MSEYDGVDKVTTEHTISWKARLTYGGDLWAEACPYCGNETVFNTTQSETAQVVTTGQTDAESGEMTRYEPDDRAAHRLFRVVCNDCGAVLLDRNTPENEGPTRGWSE